MRVPSKVIILSLFLLSVYIGFVAALEVPEHPRGRITDLTRTLSSNEISRLDQKLADFEKQTTNQIAVLMIPSLEGDNLEDYSIRLADKWKIGQKGKDNGVILLIVKNDRKLRIEVGYGLEGVLPDGLAGSIIRNEIAPLFKKGQFFNGIDRGTDAIIKAISPGFRAIKPKVRVVPQSPTTPSEWEVKPEWEVKSEWEVKPIDIFGIFFFSFIIFFLIYMFIYAHKHKEKFQNGSPYFWGGGGGFSGGGGGFSGGGGGFGGGGASGGW